MLGAHVSSLRGQEREPELLLDALKLLQNARDLPAGQEQVFASLRVSYDALEDEQKNMFLDAAFFFLGRLADTAMRAWERWGPRKAQLLVSVILCRDLVDRGMVAYELVSYIVTIYVCLHRSGFLSVQSDLRVLVSCCLVQVSEKDSMLSMHDHLRDLAYKIVREKNSNVARRTRLLGKDAEDALEDGVRA